MKEVAILLLVAVALTGCGSNSTDVQQAAGGTWQAQMLGGEGPASGLSFVTQFTIAGDGTMNFSSFQFLSSGTCFPAPPTGETPSPAGTMVLTVNQTTFQVTGTLSMTVQANGNTLTLTGPSVTGTENGLNGTTLSGGMVTGSWTLTGSADCTDTSGDTNFTMTQSASN
jgi:hypothetical protein